MSFNKITTYNLNNIQTHYNPRNDNNKRKRTDDETFITKKIKLYSPLIDEINQLTEELFSKECESVYAPFRITRHLAAPSRWKTFLPLVEKFLERKEFDETTPISSCVRTCFAVAAIFIGKEKTMHLLKVFKQTNSFKWSIVFNSNIITYKVKNLFNGIVANILKEEGNKTQDLKDLMFPHVDQFFSYCSPFINKFNEKIMNGSDEKKIEEKLNDKINKIDYNFNKNTINSLREEIHIDSVLVNNNQSKLYCVGIIAGPDYGYDHIFLLDLYFSPSLKEPRVRLIQSWVEQAELGEEFQKREYGEKDEGTWDLNEFDAFILNLKELYEPNEKRANTSYRKCFGYESLITPLVQVRIENNIKILDGFNLCYIGFAYTPDECVSHLSGIFETHSE